MVTSTRTVLTRFNNLKNNAKLILNSIGGSTNTRLMQITIGRGENVYAMNIRDAGLLLGDQLPTEDVMRRIVSEHEGPINQVMAANNVYGFKPRKSAKRSARPTSAKKRSSKKKTSAKKRAQLK